MIKAISNAKQHWNLVKSFIVHWVTLHYSEGIQCLVYNEPEALGTMK